MKARAPRVLAGIAAGAALLLVDCGGQAAPGASAPPATAAAKTSAAPAQSAKPAGPASGSLKPIKIGFSQSAVPFTPFFMGKEAGFYAKYGLDVTLQQVNGPAAVPALLADELQFDGLGANELTRAVISGAPVTSVATLGDVPVFVLMADKRYKSVEDLAGQSVGVTAVGTSTYLAAQLFLDHYKMLDRVKIAPAGGTTATVYAALTQGVVQAAIMGSDQAARAAKEGFVELVDGLKLGVPMNFSLVAVKRSYAKDNPEIVKSFLRAHQESWNYVADPANKSAIIPVITRYIQATPEIAEAGYTPWLTVWQSKKVPTIDPQGIANTLRFSDDPKARSAKPEEFIDESFLKSIQQA